MLSSRRPSPSPARALSTAIVTANIGGRGRVAPIAGGSQEMRARKRTAINSSIMAERGVPVSQRVFGEGHYLRPQFIQPYRCKNVLIEEVTLFNSPMWQVHPVLCTNVTVRGLTISGFGPNTDGCDPESCTDVLGENCFFNTGDDCIAIKSGRNTDGRILDMPSQNTIIRDCRMKDDHGGVTVGSESSGGVRNVFSENCQMDSPHLDIAVRFKNNAMRGGLIENIFARNIDIGEVATACILSRLLLRRGRSGKVRSGCPESGDPQFEDAKGAVRFVSSRLHPCPD